MTKFVLTGASGGGKSTIIAELERRGFSAHEEIGRKIVKQQLAEQGDALPWKNDDAFAKLLFARSVELYDAQNSHKEVHFFDRSFIDCIAYLVSTEQDIPQQYLDAAKNRKFANPIFICAPWPEIYEHDEERQHDFEYAKLEYQANVAIYTELGYELVEIPQLPVAMRVDFILSVEAVKNALTVGD